MTDWSTFGAWIREQRLAAGLKQHAVERPGGPGASVVKYIEEADLGPEGPRRKTLVRLAAVLDLDVDSVLVRAGMEPTRAALRRDAVGELLEVVPRLAEEHVRELVAEAERLANSC